MHNLFGLILFIISLIVAIWICAVWFIPIFNKTTETINSAICRLYKQLNPNKHYRTISGEVVDLGSINGLFWSKYFYLTIKSDTEMHNFQVEVSQDKFLQHRVGDEILIDITKGDRIPFKYYSLHNK